MTPMPILGDLYLDKVKRGVREFVGPWGPVGWPIGAGPWARPWDGSGLALWPANDLAHGPDYGLAHGPAYRPAHGPAYGPTLGGPGGSRLVEQAPLFKPVRQ